MTTYPVPFETCLLCGDTGKDVVHTWVRWREPQDGKTFGTIYRCRDRDACFRRAEAIGEPWDVNDGGPLSA